MLACISQQFGSWFSCIAGFREILRFAQNDNLKQCVILRGGLCPEESLRRFEEEELFLADVIAACEKSGLTAALPEGKSKYVYTLFLVAVQAVGRRDRAEEAIH